MNKRVTSNTYHHYPFGVIGNCSFLSYIDDHARVVWQCWPSFDSSFIFGELLDDTKGGEYSISPSSKGYRSQQRYLDNTNVLETTFYCNDGEFKVIDFAPRFELFERFHRPLMLFRKIELVSGNPRVRVICRPKGEYGEISGTPVLASNSIDFTGLGTDVRLTTDASKLHIIREKDFCITEDKYFILSYGRPLEAPLKSTFEDFLRRTILYWRKWIEQTTIPSLFQKEVIRSALVLKLHQYEDTGAIIASGTTSLPEYPGSGRNWDYRFCWMRDSYFTLSALNSLSHFSEAEHYAQYIQNIAEDDKTSFQPVYTIDNSEEMPESILDLKGYLNNGPVRIGNLANKQIQNDVYGQILLSLLPLFIDQRVSVPKTRPPLSLISKLLKMIESVMDAPDSGIWEYRTRQQKHSGTYLFHWAGCKAALKIAESCDDADVKKLATKLLTEAEKNLEICYDEKKKAYTMAQDNSALDASNFLLITMNYLNPADEKTISHMEAMEKELRIGNELIFRYRDLDDFGETHSTFTICSFWYCEALAAMGRIEEAQKVFKALLGYSNHLGLFSEDLEPHTKSQWGNFAQTYSHVGLINAAFRISRKLDKQIFEF